MTQSLPCSYPSLRPASAYKKGCRCERCRDGASAQRRGVYVATCLDCSAPPAPGSRRCADHAPAPTVRSVTGVCELCGRSHVTYPSLYHGYRAHALDLVMRTCSTCRRLFTGQIKNHRLTADQAIALMRATHCDLCRERLAGRNYRCVVEVDHDHRCCPGQWSCGACVRGFICPRCNKLRGALDALVAAIGADAVRALLD